MLQEDLSLAGLLTCSFVFLELTANFVMPAECCYQTQTLLL